MAPANVRPSTSERVIRVGGAAALLPLLVQHGIDPAPLAAEVGLSAQVFANPDNVVPFRALCRLAALAAERTGLPDIGLRACTQAGLRSLGTVGYLVAHSETVERGLAALQEYLYVHDQAAAPFFAREDATALLGYEILEPGIPGAEQVTYGALAIATNLLRELCGAGFALDGVSIAFPAPARTSEFRSYFAAPVRFGAERSAVAFAARWLEAPIPNADPYLRAVLRERVQAELDESGETAIDRIRRVVRSLVAGGKFGVDDAAAAFGVDRRTLARRLAREGTSYREVLDEARHASALTLLRRSPLPIAHIAQRLGYADSATFSRAFRRWSGTSPRDCRSGRHATGAGRG
ncbi:MAG: AraC family transcriptional regulator [Burkholderiales bacterium]